MQPLIVRGEFAIRLGRDPIVQGLIRRGLPLTRENYLAYGGAPDDGEITTELEASLPEQFQLTVEGEHPPEVILAPGSPYPETPEVESSIRAALFDLQDRAGPRPPQPPRPRMGSPYTPSDPETSKD